MNDCIEWTGTTIHRGYGIRRVKGTKTLVHRIAYEEAFGPIPPGLEVCHRCDNPPCINPDHLFLGTHHENMLDMAAKGRAQRWQAEKTHCPKGHAYDQANTYIYKNQRFCRACKSIHQANYLAKKKVSS